MKLFFIALLSSLLLWVNIATAESPTPLPSLAPVLKEVMPAIVHIKTLREQPRQPSTTGPNGGTSVSMASGVIVDAKEGYVLTNHHVISDATEIMVALNDGRHLPAKLIGSDPLSDIAVLSIEARDLSDAPLGNSDNLQVGDYVLAIGNPFGLTQTVTSGIISALGRDDLRIEGYEDFIQTDAAINPGNSGGALINLHGELIGINTAIITPEGGNVGIGFAIPINMAQSLMLQLIKFGEVRRGLLGVAGQPISQELAAAMKLHTTKGTLVSYIMPRSLAEKAGIQVGDVITAINGKTLAGPSSMRNAIGLIPIGDELAVKLWRNGTEKTIHLTMQDPKTLTSLAQEIHPSLAGVELGEINEDLLGHGHVKGLRLLSVAPGSPAAQAGLQKDDVVVLAHQKSIATIAQLKSAVPDAGEPLMLRMLRGPGAYFVVLK